MLSEQQIEDFVRDGYAVCRGLIPTGIVDATLETIWRELEIDPDNADTHPEKAVIAAHEINALMKSCRTAEVEKVAEQLAGPSFQRGGGYSPVINFPREGEAVFEPLEFHIDGIDVTTLWPNGRTLILLAYLTDTTEYGGCTAVRPGSHRVMFEHWVTTNSSPGGSTSVPDLNYADPTPVTANAGDVIFFHYLLAHASSHNRDGHPRVALNGVISPVAGHVYAPRLGEPTDQWTAIDRTLRTDILGVTSSNQLPKDEQEP